MSGVFATRSRKRPNLAAHISGAALLFIAIGVLISAVVEWGAGGDQTAALALAGGIVAAAGALMWSTTRIPTRISTIQALIAVAATWTLASIGGAVPFILTDTFPRLDDALFESVSGFSGTGSTVLSPIETAPRGVLFWRSMSQWYGGTGMVVLAVAVLPFLGVGGMELLRTEAPGPTADRLAPRISGTAARLWAVYGGFTVVSFFVLLAVGMSPFDATTHAFTVVSTGGLSPHDASIGFFDSALVEGVLVVLMLIGGTSFTLHWRFLTGDRLAHMRSPMARFYYGTFLVATALLVGLLVWQNDYGVVSAIRDASFSVATLITSTGFGTVDYVQWVPGAQLILFAIMFGGGMAGSTAGGIKLIRIRVLVEHARREITRIRRPHAVALIRLGRDSLPERIVERVIGFTLLHVSIIAVGTLALTFLGSGLVEAAGAAVGSMSNMGPSLGEAGPASNFLYFSRPARGFIMVLMLAGRLEIYPVLFSLIAITNRIRSARHLVPDRPRESRVTTRGGVE